jgi:hypothetical protein
MTRASCYRVAVRKIGDRNWTLTDKLYFSAKDAAEDAELAERGDVPMESAMICLDRDGWPMTVYGPAGLNVDELLDSLED